MNIQCLPFELTDLQSLAVSYEKFFASDRGRGLTFVDGALLPSEFLAQWLPKIIPPWIGVYALVDQKIVGTGGFKGRLTAEGEIEIGYGVAPSMEGKGVATEIVRAMVAYAKQNHAKGVVAHTLPDGIASQKVLAKNDFLFDRQVVDPEDGLVNRYIYNFA